MAYLAPAEFVTKMVDAGESKLLMSTRDTLIRSFMAGAILALAAAFAVAPGQQLQQFTAALDRREMFPLQIAQIRVDHSLSNQTRRICVQHTPFNKTVPAVELKNHRATSDLAHRHQSPGTGAETTFLPRAVRSP